MALTRKLLRGMGLTDEQVETIIEAHTDTVDGLKADIDKYKPDALRVPDLQKEIDDLKKQNANGDGVEVVSKDEYDRLKGEYDDYKNGIVARDAKTAKEAAYRELLKEAGIDPKRIDAIMKITDTESVELADDGKIKDAEARTATIKSDFADFIVTYSEKGADVSNPPANNNAEEDPFLAGFDEG